MSNQNTTAQRDIGDIADDINNAICVMKDLLSLAMRECVAGNTNRAESAIRAAGRYVEDIEHINEALFAMHQSNRTGGAQ